ncbi:hypothetical protein BGZ94_003834, partial [Podila epigama]
EYFSQLNEPNEINHLAYFKVRQATSAEKTHYNHIWDGHILQIVGRSTIRRVGDQQRHLNREWRLKTDTETFWDTLLEEELKHRDRVTRKRQVAALQEKVVDQVEDTYEYSSKRTKILNEQGLESLQRKMKATSGPSLFFVELKL